MDGFDPSTMTYHNPPMQMPHLPPQDHDPYAQHLMSMDHYSNYEVNTFAGYEPHLEMYGKLLTLNSSEDMSLHPMQHHYGQISPVPKQFTTTLYDEPFSDVLSAFDTQVTNEIPNGDNPSIERDHKLLSFSQPTFNHVLLDHLGRQATLSVSAQLHGMFFLAEAQTLNEESTAPPPPPELTCYRRNLFQITGNIMLPKSLRYVYTNQGQQIPILSQELVVSATESTEKNNVKLITVPWKTPIAPGQSAPEDKVEREPLPVALGFVTTQDIDQDYTNIPFQWKRLQFRIATANNGRRKELQQHFVIHLKVLATLANGQKLELCESHSGAVIVRGRSPRNFQARKDMPLNGSGSHVRKASHAPQISRNSTGDSSQLPNQPQSQPQKSMPTSTPVMNEAHPPAMSVHSFFDPNDLSIPPDMFNNILSNPLPKGPMTALPPDTMRFQIDPNYPASSPDVVRKPLMSKTGPISLSLIEEDPTPKRTPEVKREGSTPSKRMFPPPPRPPSFNLNTIASPDESADSLYEYFPLGLDDWMPPVDAVYRPHVVHHINVASDPRDPQAPTLRGRSKRYFSEGGC